MKKIFSLIVCMTTCISAFAQDDNTLAFTGPSKFGIEMMNAWQDNERDTITLQLTSATEADIVMPAMHYLAMNETIPSFTIHGVAITTDSETGSVTIADQTYSEVVEVNGEEKAIAGSSLTATYDKTAGTLSLTTVLKYGRMPMAVTYIIENAAVLSSANGIVHLRTADGHNRTTYDLLGRRSYTSKVGQISIEGGKKTLRIE